MSNSRTGNTGGGKRMQKAAIEAIAAASGARPLAFCHNDCNFSRIS